MRFRSLCMIIFILWTAALGAQAESPPGLPGQNATPAASQLLYNRVVISHQDGRLISGTILGAGESSLLVKSGGQNLEVPFAQMARVVIEREKDTSRWVWGGALLGTYLGNLALLTHKGVPWALAFTSNRSWLGALLYEGLFILAGGGLGTIIGPSAENSEVAFDLRGNDETRSREWDRLRRLVITGTYSPPARLHLKIQAGWVLPHARRTYGDILGSDQHSYDPLSSSDFNLMRKVQVTVSLKRRYEVGAAVVFLGEPALSAHRYIELLETHLNYSQSLSTIGYYLVGTVQPLLFTLPQPFTWNVGLGLGAAKVRFDISALKYSYHQSVPTTREQVGISRVAFSSIVFTDANFSLSRFLSLGIAADYAFVPAQKVPAVLSWDIPAKKISFGNASLGVVLGMHL